jgi:hypothetical protein
MYLIGQSARTVEGSCSILPSARTARDATLPVLLPWYPYKVATPQCGRLAKKLETGWKSPMVL